MSSQISTPLMTALGGEWGGIRQAIGGVPIVATTALEAAEAICRAATSLRSDGAEGEHVHLASAQTIALAASRADVDAAVNGTGWTLPDGKPLSWVSAVRGDEPRLRQTRGLDVFEAVCRAGASHGLRHYLLGSTPETLALMQQSMKRRFPGIEVVGSFSPPFRPASVEELAERDRDIAASGAHVVWVGLGTPKQDFEAARIAARLPVVALAVGAVFDFTAGTLHTAPKWISALGFEWFFRLLAEPRRLWRRYTLDSSTFVLAALRWGRRRRIRYPL